MHLNKIIFYTILETVTLITMLAITYILWGTFDVKESTQIAYSYTNPKEKLTINIENKFNNLLPEKDEKAISEENYINIKINNPSKIKKQYALYIKVKDSSTVDKKNIKVYIKDNIAYLTSLQNYNKGEATYYLLSNGIIKNEETINEKLYIWMSIDTPNTEQGKTLDFDLYLEEM